MPAVSAGLAVGAWGLARHVRRGGPQRFCRRLFLARSFCRLGPGRGRPLCSPSFFLRTVAFDDPAGDGVGWPCVPIRAANRPGILRPCGCNGTPTAYGFSSSWFRGFRWAGFRGRETAAALFAAGLLLPCRAADTLPVFQSRPATALGAGVALGIFGVVVGAVLVHSGASTRLTMKVSASKLTAYKTGCHARAKLSAKYSAADSR